MLRTIKAPHLHPRLVAYSATTAASAANTQQVGSMEGTFTNATSDEQLDVALNHQFHRVPVHVVCPGSGITAGGAAYVNTDPTVSALSASTVNASNAADVGQQHNLLYGHQSTDVLTYGGPRLKMQPVQGSRRGGMLVAGQVASDASINIGPSYMSATKASSVYTVTLNPAFGSTPIPLVTVINTTPGYSAHAVATSPSVITVSTFDETGSPADTAFNLMVYGWRDTDEYAMQKGGHVRAPFLDPRLLGFDIAVAAGTPSINVGAGDGSVADTAVGRATITYTDAFAREPIVIAACGTAGDQWASIRSSSTTAVELNNATNAGVAADPENYHCIVLGSDSSTLF